MGTLSLLIINPSTIVVLMILSIVGSIVSFLNLVALLLELDFVPRDFAGVLPVTSRFQLVIFTCKRGGVLKFQRDLLLNEGIYAGMRALMLGGRIKYCEYFQCGKGRDLSFFLCTYNRSVPFTDPRSPTECSNLVSVIDWVQRCTFSMLIVFGISFIPLCIQELMQRGIWRCMYSVFRHFTSLSPIRLQDLLSIISERFCQFFIDYKLFLRWLTSGNVESRKNSWISFVRTTRMFTAGIKTKEANSDTTTFMGSNHRLHSLLSLIIAQIGPKMLSVLLGGAYFFSNFQIITTVMILVNSVVRLLAFVFGPIIINAGILLEMFLGLIVTASMVTCSSSRLPSVIANFAHMASV
ncbi:hypothetical protein BOH78_3096 [Pichia kudriavzevii]|uniref:Glycosyl transferase 48 domain-containing protein n=2 Tax=Pichia kudriavzevii TaxID=4909 RepID=A0A1V2LKY1_PICKU|nr:hypothetical protein BOH78_3096 [Pichia kudriavzevii]